MHLDNQEVKGHKDNKALQDHQGHLGTLDLLVPWVQQDLLAQSVNLDHLDRVEMQDPQDLLGL